MWLTFDGDDRAELVGWLCDRDLTHPKVDEYLREAGVVDVGGPQLIARHRPGYADPCRCPLTEAVRNGTA